MLRRVPALSFAAMVVMLAALLLSCSTDTSDGAIRIESISAKPHLVSGGDVLVRVTAPESVRLAEVTATLNGADVTESFREEAEGHALLGVVRGLKLGENTLEVASPAGSGQLVLTNYPITGPMISGPHEEPFVCQSDEFELVTGELLGPPLDEDCSVETRVDYIYRTTDGEYKPLPEGPRPADLVETTTLDGRTVPFIVRVETGTVNRAVYQSSLLHDPDDPEPDPWTRSAGWNGKLVYTHGGGCQAGWNRQGTFTGTVTEPGLLGDGFALTSSSLNVYGTNCSDLLASETHMMVKERFVERYGEPAYTIGTGGSGGSYQSHQTADNYPGVFDGIIVSASFPDVISATAFTVSDDRLLNYYFTNTAPDLFTKEEQRAVSGFGQWGNIPSLSVRAARIDPVFDPTDPPAEKGGEVGADALEPLRYDPETNPEGFRPTIYDHAVNSFGTDPETGFAGRPLDNVGVQYGLAALNSGAITKEQFLDLNARIGGFDADANHVPERHEADPHAARIARETGRILHGGGGLKTTPVIDFRTYTDDREQGDIHHIVHQYSTRARITAANGQAGNHVMRVGGRWGYTEDRPDLRKLFHQMDAWLTNIANDSSDRDLAEKVVSAKPAELTDGCWDNTVDSRSSIDEPLVYQGTGKCQDLYPAFASPRQVAGGPLSNDIVKCQPKPVDAGDYEVSFTDEEMARLQEIFPGGVCDWSQPGVYEGKFQGTWLSFGPSPVNRVQ